MTVFALFSWLSDSGCQVNKIPLSEGILLLSGSTRRVGWDLVGSYLYPTVCLLLALGVCYQEAQLHSPDSDGPQRFYSVSSYVTLVSLSVALQYLSHSHLLWRAGVGGGWATFLAGDSRCVL